MSDGVRSVFTRVVIELVLVVLCLATGASHARAAWPLESAADTLLRYGSDYLRDGRTTTHTGLDVRAAEGSRVLAPVAGEITFCGSVPSGSQTVLALTITSADGLKVTMMPLLGADVAEGHTVSALEPVATLAGAGDASSPESHLHVGVRRGESYLDPSSLLGSFGPPAEDVTPQTPHPASDPGEAAAPVPDAPTVDAPLPGSTGVSQAEAAGGSAVAPEALGVQSAQLPAAAASLASPVSPAPTAAVRAVVHPGESASTPGAHPQSFRVPHARGRSIGHRSVSASPAPAFLLSAGLLALWPLWRKRGHPVPDVRPRFDDVAAAVSR